MVESLAEPQLSTILALNVPSTSLSKHFKTSGIIKFLIHQCHVQKLLYGTACVTMCILKSELVIKISSDLYSFEKKNFRGDIKPATIVLVTGAQREPDKFEILSKLLENAAIQIFTIGYPATPFPAILSLSKYAQHYSVSDEDGVLDPLKISGQLSRIFLDIISRVENQPHHQVFVKVKYYISNLKHFDSSVSPSKV